MRTIDIQIWKRGSKLFHLLFFAEAVDIFPWVTSLADITIFQGPLNKVILLKLSIKVTPKALLEASYGRKYDFPLMHA